MPAIKDKVRGTWTAQFYYVNHDGVKKRKRKRGFRLKRDALEFERDFLTSIDKYEKSKITFEEFTRMYLDDIRYKIKESSYTQKLFLIDGKILPFFKDRFISDITPNDIREWQNTLLSYRDNKGEGYSNTYLKSIYNQLNAIFNFGVRFYNLTENPCIKAGPFGNLKSTEKQIWTLDDYIKFQDAIKERNSIHSLAVEVLFFSGMRIGERATRC